MYWSKTLGLALAAQQAGLHQGWLEILDSPLGGTRVLVTLGTSSSPTTPARG